MRSVRPRPLYLLFAAALGAVALWGFWPRALPVEAGKVVRAPLTVAFTEEGRTRLRDRYVVSAPLDGVLERIRIEPGDAVAAGSAVAVLRPANAALFDPASRSEAVARWRAAGDELKAATAAATAAAALRDRLAAGRRRAETLAKQQLMPADQLDEIRAASVAAEADLRSALARARATRIQRDGAREVIDLQGTASPKDAIRLTLPSPVDGRVIRRFVESEGFVRAGEALLELGDPQALEVVVEVLTADAMRVRPGTAVKLLDWGGEDDPPLPGHVQAVEPGGFTKVSALGVEEQRVLVVVAFDGMPQRALGDGFRVDARFQVWHADSVLTVPAAALFREGTQWAVYAIENGRARLRRVQLGHLADDAAEVRRGLREGSQVVLYPGDTLRDGKRVAPSGP